MKTIDYPEALELVTKAIEQRGADHVGSECSYARSTNPGEYEPCCLVGTADLILALGKAGKKGEPVDVVIANTPQSIDAQMRSNLEMLDIPGV